MVEPSRTRLPPSTRDFVLTSPDGVLTFHVSARSGGIAIERAEHRSGGRHFIQSVRFDDEVAFVRWCQADDLCFAYPLLFSQLTRRGGELFVAGT
jgi:hypothetical protein